MLFVSIFVSSSINKPIEKNISPGEIKPISDKLFCGLLIFFLFEYVRPGSYFPILEVAKLNTIIPVTVFIFTFFANGGRSYLDILNTHSAKWLLFFIILFPIQVFTADVTLYVWNTFKAIVGYLLIYFVIIMQVTSIQRIKAVFATMVLLHIVMLALNPNVILAPEGRHYMGGTFLGDGNDFAWSVCIVVPLALFLAQTSKGKIKKILFWGSFVLLILTVIGTQSRGGSIALAASVIYLVLRSKRKVIGLIGLGALATVILLFAPQAYFDRMRTLKDYEIEGSAQGRIMAWKSAVRMADDHPFIGVGAGHFAVKYGVEYRPPGVGRTELPWSNAHSIYFLVLGEFGFTGILILLGLLLSNLGRNEAVIRKADISDKGGDEAWRNLAVAMQASLIGFSVGGAFLSGLYYPHLYVVSALCGATAFCFNEHVVTMNQHVRRKIL